MKKILVIALTLMPMLAKAQTGFEPQLKVSYELGIDEDKNQSFGGEFIAGYRLSDDFRLGLGVGIYWFKHLYENAHYNSLINRFSDEYRETASYIPVFATGKYNFVTTSELPPDTYEIGIYADDVLKKLYLYQRTGEKLVME